MAEAFEDQLRVALMRSGDSVTINEEVSCFGRQQKGWNRD